MKYDANFEDKKKFLYSISEHSNEYSDEALRLFHNRLQYFAHNANYIAALHSNGKISTQQASQLLAHHWHSLNFSLLENT
jgi:hypothetical protein